MSFTPEPFDCFRSPLYARAIKYTGEQSSAIEVAKFCAPVELFRRGGAFLFVPFFDLEIKPNDYLIQIPGGGYEVLSERDFYSHYQREIPEITANEIKAENAQLRGLLDDLIENYKGMISK